MEALGPSSRVDDLLQDSVKAVMSLLGGEGILYTVYV